MAVSLEGTVKRFIGLSTDQKPLPSGTDKIPAGSSFLESDTGRIYRWTGESWLAGSVDDGQEALLTAIYQELVRIRIATEACADIDEVDGDAE